MSLKRSSRRCSSCNKSQSTTLKLQNTSILSIYRWGQAFDHWCLSMCFFVGHTWLYKGVTFVFLLSFPLPFDWTLRCWVCVCCFVLLYFGYYVVLCVKNKKLLITKILSIYGFRDGENPDGIAESSHINGIYCIMRSHGICQSLDELIKSRSVHLNRLVLWTSICKH